MAFNASECERKLRIGKLLNLSVAKSSFEVLPSQMLQALAASTGSLHPRSSIARNNAHHVIAFASGMTFKYLPDVGENPLDRLIRTT